MSILWNELTSGQRSILVDAFEQNRTIALSLPGYRAALGLAKIGLGYLRKANSWGTDAGYFRINEQGRAVLEQELLDK